MVKIPATRAGIPAITAAIAEGININVTLIFARERYAEVMDAYLAGLEQRAAAGRSLDGIASVASFFVSRVDTLVDKRLEGIIKEGGARAEAATALLGRAAIANARLAYADFKQFFGGERFAQLQAQGARVQRPLWASTGTKNPAYSDVVYVDELIGPDTVNTVPPQTLAALLDHGQAALALETQLDQARQTLADLEELGISMVEVTDQLEDVYKRQLEHRAVRLIVALVEVVHVMQHPGEDVGIFIDAAVDDGRLRTMGPVSYTHLDVYKRQAQEDQVELTDLRQRLGEIGALEPDLRPQFA